jgi:hypothetical protein
MHTPVALLLVASLFGQESLSLKGHTRIVRSVVFSPMASELPAETGMAPSMWGTFHAALGDASSSPQWQPRMRTFGTFCLALG